MKKAFTLVELIVVVIIIGILAAVGIPQYRKALERSRGAEAYSGLGHIQEAEKIYFVENEVYYRPTGGGDKLTAADMGKLDVSLPQTGWNFTITGTNTTFTANATRGSGPCVSNTIRIDENGTLDDTDWKGCSIF